MSDLNIEEFLPKGKRKTSHFIPMVRIDDKTHEALRLEAVKTGVSVTSLVRAIILAYLKGKEE